MAEALSTQALVEQMSARDTVNGWDVLVSYREDEINNLLALRADELKKEMSDLDFEIQYERKT